MNRLPFPVGLIAIVAFAAASAPAQDSSSRENKVALGVDGSQFTLNGVPTFLLGFSYYGALGAPEAFVEEDLKQFQQLGFNWLRVWATWSAFGEDISAVDQNGDPRKPYLDRLRALVARAEDLGMVVDITLNRGEALPNFASHQHAVETLVRELKPFRNWYLDLANERDVGDARFVSDDELRRLRARVRELDPQRLVTASFGGHDLSEDDVRDAIVEIGVDFLCLHRPRSPHSPSETEAETKRCRALMETLGRTVPVHYQEPFRRGYTDWQPKAVDFQTDLRGARAGGAAGWCFHNGSTRGVRDEQPRRSFDLRQHRLFDQLDDEERAFVSKPGG